MLFRSPLFASVLESDLPNVNPLLKTTSFSHGDGFEGAARFEKVNLFLQTPAKDSNNQPSTYDTPQIAGKMKASFKTLFNSPQ